MALFPLPDLNTCVRLEWSTAQHPSGERDVAISLMLLPALSERAMAAAKQGNVAKIKLSGEQGVQATWQLAQQMLYLDQRMYTKLSEVCQMLGECRTPGDVYLLPAFGPAFISAQKFFR